MIGFTPLKSTKSMNKHHHVLLKEIKLHSRPHPTRINLQSYLGTSSKFYNLATTDKRKIAKDWAKVNKDIQLSDFLDLLDSLYQGKSHEEKTIAPEIIKALPQHRKLIDPSRLDNWLNNLTGWAEIDSTCQSIFTNEILSNWDSWKKLIQQFNKSKNISKRRASLVLLCKPVRYADDNSISSLAFENINNLKHEKDVLITKAISWLLRDLIKNHKKQVSEFLNKNSDSLPKIAIREVSRKLQTGKKN